MTLLIGLGATAVVVPVAAASAASFDPHQIVVGFARRAPLLAHSAMLRASGGISALTTASHTRLIRLAPGVSVASALARIRERPGVIWAEPDYVAHLASFPTPAGLAQTGLPNAVPPYVPDDPGNARAAGGWELLQWNFAGSFGIDAPAAWRNLINYGHPGGRGVTIAVLDTGVAYANRGRFHRSPDFYSAQFVRGHDFVGGGPYANDHNGHGTFVAGTLAESTNNAVALTGIAYGARLMPVRVLDSQGNGDASAIAAGVRFAVQHHAQLINMSLEFTSDVTAGSIPELVDAINYAYRHRVLVVAAAGNEGSEQIAYPARAHHVLAVGATTIDGCLADYSNDGPALDVVAPGGGSDADIPGDPRCQPNGPPGPDIYQETFTGANPRKFGLPPGYEGTSMATPHVTAIAALVIASGVLGPRPTPLQIVERLKATATPLGTPGNQSLYGAGLVNAAAATAPGGPGAVSSSG
jgi:serine protease